MDMYRSIRICMLLLITTYNAFGTGDVILFVASYDSGSSGIYFSDLDLSDTNLSFAKIDQRSLQTNALDYDPYTSTIYSSDDGYESINSYSLVNNESVSLLEGVKGVNGIAVDGIGQKLYWTSTVANRIEVINLNGSERTILIDTDLSDPRDIELDLANRYLYWTDTENKVIERANLDDVKNTRKPLITANLNNPTGLVLSVLDGKMYWCDAGHDYIGEANLDGSNTRIVAELKYSSSPFPNDIDIYQGYLYGTDQTSRIFRVNMHDWRVTIVSEGAIITPRGIYLKTDECNLLKCQNHGECIKENGVESCACQYGFTGATCQRIVGYCPCP